MKWIPTFEIGLWNAWIPALFLVIHPFIMAVVDKIVGSEDLNIKMGEVPVKEEKKKNIPIPTILLILLFILSIFLPLKLGSIWFFSGLVVYLAGLVMFLSSIITAAKSPLGQVFSQGMYRYSRHPLYLSIVLIFVGVSLASASWLFLVLSLGWSVIPLSQVKAEEQACLKTFGTEYQVYMDRTPKWLGIPKSK